MMSALIAAGVSLSQSLLTVVSFLCALFPSVPTVLPTPVHPILAFVSRGDVGQRPLPSRKHPLLVCHD